MNRRRFRLLAAGLAALAGGIVLFTATELFPHHTTNHDEAVYLQQAAMLLDGQLSLSPPVADSFRPWFFVEDGGRLYPKYAPVPAAMFAVGKLLGGFRLSLAAIAAGNVALTTALAAEAFDRRTGLLAGALLLASPLFLIDSSVFLPYAPTTFWNLLFAFAYVRSARRGAATDASARQTYGYALLAGLAVGAAFFSRPYTSVLFATPFIAHALYSLVAELSRVRVARLALTALGGLAGVAVALGYNAAMTGSAWTFPYAAFAPEDGLGFGHREILGYARDYTPELALRANAEVVELLFTEWVVGGLAGTLLAALGVGLFLRRAGLRPAEWSPEFTDAQLRAVLAGLFVSVVVGNVYFWGNLNVLGSLENPDDGLAATLGPYYHFDLLVPTAAFAARGALGVVGGVRDLAADRGGVEPARSRRVAAVAALAVLVALAGSTAGVLAPVVSENATITDEYEAAYQPFEAQDQRLSDAVVFLPTTYGGWLNHPFQSLRNDPGFDGETVYALSGGPSDLDVTAAYPNRSYYRYVYRGRWNPYDGDPVEPALHRVRVARGASVSLTATLEVPDRAESVSARLSTGDEAAYYAFEGTPASLPLELRVANETARLDGPGVRSVGDDAAVPVAREDEVVVEVFVGDPPGGFSYRLELPVRRGNGSIAALSPVREVCLVARNCADAAAYVADAVPEHVGLETTLRANESVAHGGNATARSRPGRRSRDFRGLDSPN